MKRLAVIEKAIEESSTTMGVEFVNDVDKGAFRQHCYLFDGYCNVIPLLRSDYLYYHAEDEQWWYCRTFGKFREIVRRTYPGFTGTGIYC